MKVNLTDNKPEPVVFSTLTPGTFCQATEAMDCRDENGVNDIYIVCSDTELFSVSSHCTCSPIKYFMVYPLVEVEPVKLEYLR